MTPQIHRLRQPKPPPLDEDLILTWADAYFERNGVWPKDDSGKIPECDGETWQKVDSALRVGLRGLLAHSSLPLLLQDKRGVVNQKNLPHLNIVEILSRGLTRGSSLSRLLKEKRGVFNQSLQANLTIDQILAWADSHKTRHGKFPKADDGVVEDAADDLIRFYLK